jgi:UDP-N-acetylglucosamine--N-acetylmuramyl-(pentapeptide) pyrophosphoryl-undecaprenol N-acetylglucosamine transferase
MALIYAGVYGSGLGHATRTFAIAQKVAEEGNHFVYSSFEEGLDFLNEMRQEVWDAPSIGLKWNVAGGVSGMDTLISSPATLFRFWRQIQFESELIRKYNPRAVLSDSRLSTLFAAKSLFYPVITILNQVKILFPSRFRDGRIPEFLERVEGDILGLFWSVSDEVLFPDLPPPYTISEANVKGVDVSNKITFTGFMAPQVKIEKERLSKVKSSLQLDDRPLVFVQISGPTPTKQHFFQTALDSSEVLAKSYNLVISKGMPNGSIVPIKLSNGTWLYDWCPIKDELFLLSDLLVARAGHTTISQCINAAKPSVLVPIYNHSEQLWNADKFVKLGLGEEVRSEDLTSERLINAVDNCVQDGEFKSKIEHLREVSERYPGVENAARILKAFL